MSKEEEQTEADSDESTCSEEFNFLEKRVHEFFHDLKHYDMTPWDVDSVYKLISNLADLKIKEFDDFNIALSMTLGEMIRHWCPEPSNTAELFLRLGISSGIIPLSPNSDKNKFSLYIITACSNIQVRRIKETVTKDKMF